MMLTGACNCSLTNLIVPIESQLHSQQSNRQFSEEFIRQNELRQRHNQ